MAGAGVRIVLTTAGSAASASQLANRLVELRLAACVNVIPGLTSVYRWQGEIETASEVLLLIKTGADQITALEAAIRELHAYEVPEFLVLPVEAGSLPYLDWLLSSLQP